MPTHTYPPMYLGNVALDAFDDRSRLYNISVADVSLWMNLQKNEVLGGVFPVRSVSVRLLPSSDISVIAEVSVVSAACSCAVFE